MWIRLRQIAVVTEDLRKSALDIGTVLGAEACFTDPGVKTFGLKNTLWPIGTQFLEVVTPIEAVYDEPGGHVWRERMAVVNGPSVPTGAHSTDGVAMV
ncbi:MAG: hypothetical protein GY773_05515, partial [Actinomycetia bacterium]|nr:hypothetical protein [Actinomycetes bacterium]